MNEHRPGFAEKFVAKFKGLRQSFKIRRVLKTRTVFAVVLSCMLFAAASFGALVVAEGTKQQAIDRLEIANRALDQQRIEDIAEAAAAAELARKKSEEQAMAGAGFKPAGNGLYYRWAKRSEFTCGYWDCAVIGVVTASETCSGVYVEANITRGGAAIGMTNDTVGALGPWDTAVLTLEDYVGGDGFELTKINCW